MCWFGYLRRSIEKVGVSVRLWYRSNGFYFGCVGLISNVYDFLKMCRFNFKCVVRLQGVVLRLWGGWMSHELISDTIMRHELISDTWMLWLCWRFGASHCTTMQHTAIHYITLQRTATQQYKAIQMVLQKPLTARVLWIWIVLRKSSFDFGQVSLIYLFNRSL